MKLILLLGIVIAILATVAACARPRLEPMPMGWSTVTGTSGLYYKVATKKDLLVYLDMSNSGNIPSGGSPYVISVRRRNAEGVYVPVANISDIYNPTMTTNGKWIAIVSGYMNLFRVDSNNNVSEPSSVITYGGYLLSDDTFVGYDPISPLNDGNYTIRSYKYEPSNNTWNNIPGTEVFTTPQVYDGYYSSYHATDSHLIFAYTINDTFIQAQIYSRQADKSWKFIESVPIHSSFGLTTINLNYNNVDTLVVSFSAVQLDSTTGAGYVYIYTKMKGQWTEQTFTTTSVGYRPQGNLGGSIEFLDTNNLFVSAATEGYIGEGIPSSVGKLLLMTRNSSGLWEPSIDIINPTNSGIWGSSVGINDYDIIIPILNFNDTSPSGLMFSTLPLCFLQPINVTCTDQQVNNCSQLDISSLFTVSNNAQCGEVSATLNGLSPINNQAVQAQLSFTKATGQIASCNATVMCPAPPVVTQTPSSKVVSGASGVELSAAALLSLAVMFV